MTFEDSRGRDGRRRHDDGKTAAAGVTGSIGLYGPGSVAWRLNREATLLLGAGPRALLLQLAHPLVAEGVDQHSNFREQPWRRLQETLRSYLRIVYGTPAAGWDEIERLGRLHQAVRGPNKDPVAREIGGERYAARDPELSLWVHATLIDSTLVAYERWIEPLAPRDRAAFYAETRPVGLAFGIPDAMLPADMGAFDAYVRRMLEPGGPIVVSGTARRLSQTILHPPLGELAPAEQLAPVLDAIPTPLYDWLMWPAIDLLPDRIRDEYAIPWTPLRSIVARWVTSGFRLWRPLLPAGLRWMPQALAADRRAGIERRGGAATAGR